MAYACPVCETPQVDARHLANHVAFTAIAGDDAHEAWLDETVEGWGRLGEETLGERLVEHAAEVEYPLDLGDEGATAGHGASGERGERAERRGSADRSDGGDRRDHGSGPVPSTTSSPALDEDDRAVLEEARELTRRMQADDETDGTDAGRDGKSDDHGDPSDGGNGDRDDRGDGGNGDRDARGDGGDEIDAGRSDSETQ